MTEEQDIEDSIIRDVLAATACKTTEPEVTICDISELQKVFTDYGYGYLFEEEPKS